MRNTEKEPDILDRETVRLIEDLCLSLRDVGGRISRFPPDARAMEAIASVCDLHAELQRRGVTLHSRLTQLTEETGWLMPRLLEDCLQWPAQVPYVRELDGIRRMFRCPLCANEEIPDCEGIWLGTTCLQRVSEAILNRAPFTGIIIYRTYNPDLRCRHADDETVLSVTDDEYDLSLRDSFCDRCVTEELARRETIGV